MGTAAIVLAVGLVGAFTVDADDDKPASLAVRDDATTTTAETVPVDESPVIGVTTTLLLTNASTTSTRPPATTTTIKIPDPGPTKPPAPGAYGYKFVYATDPSRNADITEQISAQPDQNGVHYRKETYPDGQGNTLTNDVAYAADAVRLTMSHIASAQTSIDCGWTPPIVLFLLPLAVGKTWSYDSKCSATVSGAQATVQKKGDNKVIGKSLDTIGNVAVRTWVIEEHTITSVSHPFFNTTRDAVVTRHWAPDYGLITFEKEVGKTNGQDYTTERTLQNVKPR